MQVRHPPYRNVFYLISQFWGTAPIVFEAILVIFRFSNVFVNEANLGRIGQVWTPPRALLALSCRVLPAKERGALQPGIWDARHAQPTWTEELATTLVWLCSSRKMIFQDWSSSMNHLPEESLCALCVRHWPTWPWLPRAILCQFTKALSKWPNTVTKWRGYNNI